MRFGRSREDLDRPGDALRAQLEAPERAARSVLADRTFSADRPGVAREDLRRGRQRAGVCAAACALPIAPCRSGRLRLDGAAPDCAAAPPPTHATTVAAASTPATPRIPELTFRLRRPIARPRPGRDPHRRPPTPAFARTRFVGHDAPSLDALARHGDEVRNRVLEHVAVGQLAHQRRQRTARRPGAEHTGPPRRLHSAGEHLRRAVRRFVHEDRQPPRIGRDARAVRRHQARVGDQAQLGVPRAQRAQAARRCRRNDPTRPSASSARLRGSGAGRSRCRRPRATRRQRDR